MVSEGARPWGRGRSGDSEKWCSMVAGRNRRVKDFQTSADAVIAMLASVAPMDQCMQWVVQGPTLRGQT